MVGGKTSAFDYKDFPPMPLQHVDIVRCQSGYLTPKTKYKLPFVIKTEPLTKNRVLIFSRVPKCIEISITLDNSETRVVNRFNQMCSSKVWEGIEWARRHEKINKMGKFEK